MISLRILFVVLAFFRGQFQQKKTGVGGRQQRLAIHYSLEPFAKLEETGSAV
jgi:hypothetical protein